MMIYTIISDDMQSYDLPGKTLKVVEKIEELMKADTNKNLSIREKYKKLHSFVIDMLGKESAKEILGGDKLDELDLSVLTITCRKIVDAYEKPIEEYSNGKIQQTLEDIPLDKVTELLKVAEKEKK